VYLTGVLVVTRDRQWISTLLSVDERRGTDVTSSGRN